MAFTPDKKKTTVFSSVYDTFMSSESSLKRYLRRYFFRREDIDDMAQETFLRAYKYSNHKDIEYPKAYLFQVAKSVAMRELSRKTQQMTDYLDETVEADPEEQHTLEEEVMAEQTLGVFCQAIADLPPQCRRVFLMRKFHAMPHRQIAEELNISVSAVEQHITTGLKRCKAQLDKQGGEERVSVTPIHNGRRA